MNHTNDSRQTLGGGISETELAYFAGLFDGEGCVNIVEVKPKPGRHSPTFQTLAQVSMTDRRSLDLLIGSFGGRIRLSTKEGSRPIWVWRAYHKNAKKFLEDVLPYLVVKKHQAELLIELEERVLGRGMQKRLSTEEIERQRRLKEEVCANNGPFLYAKYREALSE